MLYPLALHWVVHFSTVTPAGISTLCTNVRLIPLVALILSLDYMRRSQQDNGKSKAKERTDNILDTSIYRLPLDLWAGLHYDPYPGRR